MQSPSTKSSLVAVDLGAQSCRVALLRWKQNIPCIEVIHRFSNAPVSTGNGLRWDLNQIVEGVTRGLQLCAEAAPHGIASIGVDGWAVDYVRLQSNGIPVANPFCYRDERTITATEEVHRRILPDRLYALTGIQILSLNTLYQLYADKLAGMDQALRWLNIPEYITHQLGGNPVAEYTNATHTQLVKLGTTDWCGEIFHATGLEKSAAPEIVPTGTVVGEVRGPLSALTALRGAKLIVPACHDTASAIAAIPASGNDWAFISSGTWSLVGTVLKAPCVTDEARDMNFTNLGGVGGSVCFLKNVNGMWLLRQCMDEWEQAGQFWCWEDLLSQCASQPQPRALIDVDDPQLMSPGNMLVKVNAQLEHSGEKICTSDSPGIPRLANIVFHSLARRYAEVLTAIARITGKSFKRLFIVGGGSQNVFLNRLTAQAAGLEVIAGSTESTTMGNFAIQMASLENDETSSNGVTAAAVSQFAGQIVFDSAPLVTGRETS